MNPELEALARAAGLERHWRDVAGADHLVSEATLRAVLGALDLPAESPAQIAASAASLSGNIEHGVVPLITADLGIGLQTPGEAGSFRITLESGRVVEGRAEDAGDGRVALPGIDEAGYHRLELGETERILAVAPLRAYTLQDAGGGGRLWGIAAQLYALRREGDGGIGDFAALAELAELAAGHGADVLAISPVHALFSANPQHFSPYAPSNRAALNVLHIAEPNGFAGGELIDWPQAGRAKLAALRQAFGNFRDPAGLAEFRRETGARIERHAAFEAIQAVLAADDERARDWRNWPAEFRDPLHPETLRFLQAHAGEVDFHAYLQYRADRELQAAQRRARQAGMRVGLIADLAVGADHAGSQSWAYQNEVLRGLEIGAPPDIINREGQSWGITALSPLGLRKNGFTAYLEMLRHALRHAGGVRIDHIMGLARLWVIPIGARSDEGAYLRLPVEDMLRLVALESLRHKAVIIGEDLGTLPEGFQELLDRTGIAGLRVMWFERDGERFSPPRGWSKTAVAMSTTHDLPTVAGWWRGTDIAWRRRLGMGSENEAQRAADRAELWAAFRRSGATALPAPPPEEGAAAADAACAHVGSAAATLALLPLEDVLALPEQPNLPGTDAEHPNWRRRLPAPAATLLNRPEVAARLAALTKARAAP